jgi:hypothetical protein
LRFTPQQIEKIARYAKENMEQETKDRKLLQESQAQKLKEVIAKIERLEERLIKDEIETITYKKWFTKLSAEKGVLETAISNLAKSHTNIFEKLQQAIPALIHNYSSIKQKGLLLLEQPNQILPRLNFCTAYGIRTRITTVKGWCPSP